ncbi:hypothetical protein niasHT_028143 [Heterodera trifolii]|uniref:IRS-type PTB domain-containing protein n=1 Tax=Heterodera trifolii TaxID=157864 RepID=A0ABD2JNR6_9BILA
MGGNCSNEHHHQSRLFRAENFTNDPSAFRVFVKKRNKFIPGWLKINDDEIVFSRGGNNFQFWPLAHLRRYGYTCSGVFFFESGRRCATGEGLHTFQSHQAERIFHMVQSKIKIEEYARCGSRATSVASNGTHRVHSLVPNPGGSARIHPIQRFSSEGAANNEFPPSSADSVVPPPSAPPPPYSAYAVTAATDARRMRQNGSPNSNCPSVVSALSSSMIPQHFVRPPGGGPMADPPALSRDRPRSVVSNIEHGVVLHHRLPHATNTAGQPSPLHHAQAVTATPQPPPSSSAVASALFHHHRSPQNVTSSNSASSLMTMAAMMHHQQQRQQQQQNSGFALPPSALNALAASASGSCLMNQSFHSVLDSTGGVSPWASQQQLEGEIVLEHVLGVDSRRRLTPSKGSGGHSPNAAVAEPIRVAVPPPRLQQTQQMQQFTHPSSSSSVLLSSVSAAPTTTPRHCHSGGGESTAAYVNVDFSAASARHATDRDNGISPEEFAKQQLNVRELHRTDHSRLEFLSTGPGAFMLSSSYGPMSMSTSMVASAHPSEALATALPPALLHHHHQQQKNAHLQQQHQQHCMHHSFYAPPRGLPSGAFHGQQMSASVCGTLPTDDQPAAPLQHWHPQQQSNNESGDGIGIRRFDAQQHHPIGSVNAFSPSKMPSSPQVGAVQQQTTNPSLSNTTTASSTPS